VKVSAMASTDQNDTGTGSLSNLSPRKFSLLTMPPGTELALPVTITNFNTKATNTPELIGEKEMSQCNSIADAANHVLWHPDCTGMFFVRRVRNKYESTQHPYLEQHCISFAPLQHYSHHHHGYHHVLSFLRMNTYCPASFT
jgi:hypothetical protein